MIPFITTGCARNNFLAWSTDFLELGFLALQCSEVNACLLRREHDCERVLSNLRCCPTLGGTKNSGCLFAGTLCIHFGTHLVVKSNGILKKKNVHS
jgi:hypothetical protein